MIEKLTLGTDRQPRSEVLVYENIVQCHSKIKWWDLKSTEKSIVIFHQ